MSTDQSDQDDEKSVLEGIVEPRKNLLPYLPSEVQLQNVFALEIAAKRFLVDMSSVPVAQLIIEGVQVNPENLQARVILNVKVEFSTEPRPFEVAFKLLGQFAYAQELTPTDVQMFLEMGSLSIMLPFAREMLFNLCTRLQVPPIMLSMVKLAPPPSIDDIKKEYAPK